MKLATLPNGRPDGHLVVVARDLSSCVSAGRIAPHLQAALDEWKTAAPALEDLSRRLNAGEIAGQPFDPLVALAPLPRAYQWIDGSGYLSHLDRMRALDGSHDMTPSRERPMLYQGGSDMMLGAGAPIVVTDLSAAVDFEAELAAIIGPVSMGAGRMEAESALRLLMLCNDVSLRRLVSDDLQRGFGFFHAKPATGFGPVAVTPDELAPYWRDGRLHLTAEIDVNERSIGRLDMADGVDFDLADITGEAARTRRLSAGTIVGSGTISNPHDEILPLRKDAKGFACIAEARMMERLKYDRARTSFLKQGDRVRISVVTGDGTRPMGTILQTVETA